MFVWQFLIYRQLNLTKHQLYQNSDRLEDDQISETTSGDSCSVGVVNRISDSVGLSDVQHLARMQEESKKWLRNY